MGSRHPKRNINTLQLKLDNTHAWVKNLSGLFSLPPAHVRFVAMLVALMERDGKTVIDTQVRIDMLRIHKIKSMRGIYVIIGRLKKVGVIDERDRLHPLLDFVNGKQVLQTKEITIRFERQK